MQAFLGIDFSVQKEIKQSDKPTVERTLEAQNTSDSHKNDFVVAINQERIIKEILDNTPCGYVLMDTSQNVLFASNYFYSFMGLTEENVIGHKCYYSNNVLGEPCKHCSIMKSVQSKQVEYMRNEQNTRNGRKIFDMYGVPLPGSSGEIEYVIEIIIDRTDEIIFEHQSEVDYEKLIQMLNDTWKKQNAEDGEETLVTQTYGLHKRLKELMYKENQ